MTFEVILFVVAGIVGVVILGALAVFLFGGNDWIDRGSR
jgi:hypothetical protein